MRAPHDRSAFASRLDAARRGLHLSIRDLARQVGVPAPTVQGWLSGRHFPVPALRPSYLQMAAILGVEEVPESLWGPTVPELRPRLDSGTAPYLGLRAFSVADRDLFFGRQDEARRLAAAIRAVRQDEGAGVLVVTGASGSGKSSLLAAGLLGGECVDGSLAGWTTALASVAELTAWVEPAQLVVIDQFEEYFSLDEPERTLAAEHLAELAGAGVVVLGMRADAFSAASLNPRLAGALARPFLVAPMTREQARDVILQPARSSGVRVDPDLVPALLEDLGVNASSGVVSPEALPLLSNALLVTWAAGTGTTMTLSDYVRSGGLWSALEELAEQAYGELDEAQQASVRAQFLRLVRTSGELVTRETLTLDDLDAAATEALRPFVDARLLTVDAGRVRISHEALISNWTRLQDWLRDSRADRALAEQLRRAAGVWVESGRSEDALIPVDRLEIFSEWVADPQRQPLLGPKENEFLAASREHFTSVLAREQRVNTQLRRGRRIAIAATAVATALALAAGALYVRGLGLQADTQAARSEAESRQVALEARSVRADDPSLMAQMALVSASLATTRQGVSALLDASGANVPLRWLGRPNAIIAQLGSDQLVARADGSGQVTIWRGAELTISPGTTVVVDPHGGPLYALALARVDGRDLMAVGGGSAVGLWDVTATPTLLTDLTAGKVTVYGADFSRDGHRLALATSTGAVSLWSVSPSGAVASGSVSIGEQHPAKAVAFHPSRDELFVAGQPDAVARFSLAGGPARLADLGFSYANSKVVSQTLAISPDGTQLAVGIAGRRVPRWSLADGKTSPLPALTGFNSWTNDLSFSADGKTLIAANSDKNTYLFDPATGALRQTLTGPTVNTGAELVGDRPVTSGADGVLRVWSATDPLLRSGSTVYQLAADAAGRFLAAGAISGGPQLWDGSAGAPVRLADPVTGGRSMGAAVAIAPDGRFLYGGTTDGSVLAWPLSGTGAGAATTTAAFPGSYIGLIAVSPDSSIVAVLQYTGTQVALYRAEPAGGLTLLAKLDTPTPQSLAFSPDGTLLAVPIADGSVQLWDVARPENPALAGRIEGIDALPTVAVFANHARTLAIGTDAGRLQLWDVGDPARPALQRVFGDPHASLYGIAFGPDDSTVFASGGDGFVWGWHLDGLTSAFLSLDGSMGSTNDVRLIDGGRRLIAGGETGAVRIWTADPAAARTELCANRGDVLTAEEWARFLPGVAPRDPC